MFKILYDKSKIYCHYFGISTVDGFLYLLAIKLLTSNQIMYQVIKIQITLVLYMQEQFDMTNTMICFKIIFNTFIYN